MQEFTREDLISGFKAWAEEAKNNPEEFEGGPLLTDESYPELAADFLIDKMEQEDND